tara:strand:- start:520 stop:696 length:177 start_codon:yes stop_codon:yes gene_type:complete
MKDVESKIRNAQEKIDEYLNKQYPTDACPIEIGMAQVMLEEALEEIRHWEKGNESHDG